jgi:hypothetical protein
MAVFGAEETGQERSSEDITEVTGIDRNHARKQMLTSGRRNRRSK